MLDNAKANRTHIIMIVLNNVKLDARVKREAIALKAKGYSIKIVGIKDNPDDVLKTNYKGVDIELIPLRTRKILPKNPLGWSLKYLELIIKVFIKLTMSKIDIIHAHDLNALFPAYLLSKMKRCKIIYDSHELYTEMAGNRSRFINLYWRKTEKYLIRRTDRVIAANISRAIIMYNEYGAREIPEVIMNIPSIQSYSVKNKTNNLQLFLKSSGVLYNNIVLYQGGIGKHRKIDNLVLSVRYWAEQTILILLGPVTEVYKSDLINLIQTYHLSDKVFFHPAVNSDELLSYTKSADVGVVIYDDSTRNNYYCAPNKLFEYTFSGIPIIACNFPELRRIINNYGVGELFNPNDMRSISNAVNKIITNKSYYMSYKKLEILTKKYNWENEKAKLYQLYKSMV